MTQPKFLIAVLAAGLLAAALVGGLAAATPDTEIVKLTASDAAAGDWFGRYVAVSGATVVVGAPNDDDNGSNSGSAYVFVRSGISWSQQAKLTASDAAAFDFFGVSVAISGDTAVVGANFDDGKGVDSGSAYVFVRSGTTWTEQAKLTASDAAALDQFGIEVSISGDTAVVGAFSDDDSGSRSGSAYVFVHSGATWTEQAKLTASDAAIDDRFGRSVSVSGDTAVVGAVGDDDDGQNSGSAYVFVRSGTTWTEQAKLTASDAATFDIFGISVSISGDTALVAAWLHDDNFILSGAAYMFVRSGTTWTEQAKLPASDPAANDRFGVSVSISGETAVVGAYLNDDTGSDSGSAYVFEPAAPANTPPVANAGADQLVECSSSTGAVATLNGALSSDPDGDPLSFAWTGPSFVGTLTGATPSVQLPLGTHTITLVVNDGAVDAAPDTVLITVRDTTPPTVNASLTLVGDGDHEGARDDDDEGNFLIGFSASNLCDPNATVTAVLVVQGFPTLIPVTNGQIIEFEIDDEIEVEVEEGELEIEAPALTLRVTATDASGNTTVAEVQATGLAPDNDTELDLDD